MTTQPLPSRRRKPRRKSSGSLHVLKNEPRVVTDEAVQRLEEHGASPDLVDAARRAAKTNPGEKQEDLEG
jgi:hypothetical protein